MGEKWEFVKVVSILIEFQANMNCVKIQESRAAAEQAQTSTACRDPG